MKITPQEFLQEIQLSEDSPVSITFKIDDAVWFTVDVCEFRTTLDSSEFLAWQKFLRLPIESANRDKADLIGSLSPHMSYRLNEDDEGYSSEDALESAFEAIAEDPELLETYGYIFPNLERYDPKRGEVFADWQITVKYGEIKDNSAFWEIIDPQKIRFDMRAANHGRRFGPSSLFL